MPIVSANTEARVEGYFRREWKLAVDRTHDLSERVAFLVPIVIDSIPEAKADVPDAFRHVQWTRVPGGNASPAFAERIRRLITPVPSSALSTATAHPEYMSARISTTSNDRHRVARVALWALSGVVALGFAYFVADRLWLSKHGTDVRSVAKPADDSASNGGLPDATVATFNPPPHSIAVLPFINMSGDKEQEYFSDGLTEEILNSLARITQLQVTGRTSSFYFKGEHSDLATIARKLNVAALLEGSVRRSANRVRITTQLINTTTGFHLWSQTYDRDLGDVLKLQSEIADAVASALKVTLLGDIATKIELGGTRNPAAFDAYLRGAKALNNSVPNVKLVQTALASFTEAIRLDANYALAFAGRSLALIDYSAYFVTGAAIREGFDKALGDARHALALAPELPEGQMALARIFAWGALDFTQASEAWERAMSLAPGDARILREYGMFAALMGRPGAGLAAARRAVVLDPLGARSHFTLGQTLFLAHHYPESVTA